MLHCLELTPTRESDRFIEHAAHRRPVAHWLHGRTAIGMILGLSSMIMVIGQIGGPLIAGAFADWLGNYRVGFTIIAVLAAIGSLFFWMAKRPVQRHH